MNDYDENLLEQIRTSIPSIRLVLGYCGSAIPETNIWQHLDIILSCAPEAVAKFREMGCCAEQISHAFAPCILGRLKNQGRNIDVSFIGQLVRRSDFHMYRESLLKTICTYQKNISIYSPHCSIFDRRFLASQVYNGMQVLKKMGFSATFLAKLPYIGRVALRTEPPIDMLDPRLRRFVKPAVFGLAMFQVLKNSKITLNIHADSSPLYASNMRLFEATGVGTCLVTDWKQNIAELFAPDVEIVTYKTAEECMEKLAYLLDHEQERDKIAQAGQARTLKEHTFTQRAQQLDEIIRRLIKGRK